MRKAELEALLLNHGLSADPWTAEQMLLHMPEAEKPTPEILDAIFKLKRIIIFEAFGHDPRYLEDDGNETGGM